MTSSSSSTPQVSLREFVLDTPTFLKLDPYWAEFATRTLLSCAVGRLAKIQGTHTRLTDDGKIVVEHTSDAMPQNGKLLALNQNSLMKLVMLDSHGVLHSTLRSYIDQLPNMTVEEAIVAGRKALRDSQTMRPLEGFLKASVQGDQKEMRRWQNHLQRHNAAVQTAVEEQQAQKCCPPKENM